MKKWIIAVALLLPLTLMAQKNKATEPMQMVLAKDAQGQDVTGYFIASAGKITDYGVPGDGHYLYFTDDQGTSVYDTRTLEYKGRVKLRSQETIIDIGDEGILVYVSNKKVFTQAAGARLYGFDGRKKWDNDYCPFRGYGKASVVLCHRNYHDGDLVGCDWKTGAKLWEMRASSKLHLPLCNDYNRDNYHYMIADSLVRVDVLTGQTVSHGFQAGVKEPLKSMFRITGMASPANQKLLRELNYSQWVDKGIFTGLHSNWVVSSDTLFVADATQLYCFDRDLHVRWQTPLPQDMGAKSEIRLQGGRIYLINYGVTFMYGQMIHYGKPFAAEYDAVTGRQLSLTCPDISKKVVGARYADGGRIYWQTQRNFYYSDAGDSATHQIKWRPQTDKDPSDGYVDYVLLDTIGVAKDGVLRCVTTDAHRMVVAVYTHDANLVTADGQVQVIPAGQYYSRRSRYVYSTTFGSDRFNSFVVIDPDTHAIRYSLSVRGWVWRGPHGNIYIVSQQGLGVIRHQN